MIRIAAAFLVLPNGTLVFQRRTADAAISPGLLGLFGGHIESGETAEAAIERELKEETSLPVNELTIKHVDDYDLPATLTGHHDVKFHLYEVEIPSLDFKVFEGVGAEAYSVKDVLARSDIAPSIRYLLEKRRK